jgi:hypothetical protein
MKAKRDHYVPQAYLESWHDSSGIFYVWDREKNIIHDGHTRSVMFIPGHLTKDEYGKAIDDYFHKYESSIKPIITKICSYSDRFIISEWEYVLLSGYIEPQYIRVPKIADINNNTVGDLLSYIMPNALGIYNMRDWFAIMNWSIFKSDLLPFITTDSPVIVFDKNILPDQQILQPETLHNFMHKRDTTVCFPLDMHHILYMQHFVEFPSRKDELVTLNYKYIQDQSVNSINQLMVLFSGSRVVCNNLSYLRDISNGAKYENKSGRR